MHVRRMLWLDAAVEAVAAVVLLALAGTVAAWFGLDATVIAVLGGVFVAAAVGVAVLALAPAPGLVRILALLNIGVASAAWVVVIAAWGALSVEGRWLMGGAADAFILVGLLELRALRRGRVGTLKN